MSAFECIPLRSFRTNQIDADENERLSIQYQAHKKKNQQRLPSLRHLSGSKKKKEFSRLVPLNPGHVLNLSVCVEKFFSPSKKIRPTRTSSDWFRDVLGRRIFRIFFSSFFRWQKCVCVSVCMCAWCYKPIREIRSAESFFWWLCGPTFANQVPRRSHTQAHKHILG